MMRMRRRRLRYWRESWTARSVRKPSSSYGLARRGQWRVRDIGLLGAEIVIGLRVYQEDTPHPIQCLREKRHDVQQ